MDLASAQIFGNGTNLHVAYGNDKGLLVEFVDDAVYQEFESKQAGRAIYKQVPFVSIIFPGDKTKKTYRPASDEDKARFKAQWDAFEKGGVEIANGTPITEWNYLSKSQALELKHMGFWTVEMLAGASDTGLASLMGGHLLRKQAQTFIDTTKDDSKYTSLVAENDQLKSSMKLMMEQMETLKARVDATEKNKLKSKGE